MLKVLYRLSGAGRSLTSVAGGIGFTPVPELPEVETIRRELLPLLAGRRIGSVVVARREIVGFPGPDEFVAGVAGRRIAELGRRGKYLVFKLDKGKDLVFHLRLSGHLEVCRNGSVPRFERIRFRLSGGAVLSFVEPRLLGRVYLVDSGRYPEVLAGMERMGPEPIEPGFTVDYLAGKLKGRTAAVKGLLLDQRICCGVGNIYSDEALHRARVRPTRRGGRLTRAEVVRLTQGLRRVLSSGIRWCGTTLGDGQYVRPGTERGGFQKHLRVFGREGLPCRRRGCDGTVKRIRLVNRSSYFCPNCQV